MKMGTFVIQRETGIGQMIFERPGGDVRPGRRGLGILASSDFFVSICSSGFAKPNPVMC